jgi:hypothetical protein
MNTNMLVLASGLSDQDLLARIDVLAGKEREASVELVAHLAVLETRPSLYAAQRYGSLFSYCTQAGFPKTEVREAHIGAILHPPVRRTDGARAPSP